jgi:diguanylate cyclase (GGDEF)-like protein
VRRLAREARGARSADAVHAALAAALLDALAADQVHVQGAERGLAFLPGRPPEAYRLASPAGVVARLAGGNGALPATGDELPAQLTGPFRVRAAVAVRVGGEVVLATWTSAHAPDPEELGAVEALGGLAAVVLEALEARAAADIDALTGVLNHGAIVRRLDEEVARAWRTGAPLGCLLLDLDDFKDVNDRWGHLTGDAVLRQVGAALLRDQRPGDHVGRYGGDEFVVVLPAAAPGDAGAAAERVLARIRDVRVLAEGADRTVSASVGAASLAPPRDGDELLHAADMALREGKRGGKDRVVVSGGP